MKCAYEEESEVQKFCCLVKIDPFIPSAAWDLDTMTGAAAAILQPQGKS